MKMTLSRKIALFFGILIIVVSVALGVIAIKLSSDALLKQQEEMMLNYADETANYVSATLDKDISTLNELAIRAGTATMDFAVQQESLKPDIERLGYEGLALALPNGSAKDIASGEVMDLKDREYFKTALSGKACISGVLINKLTGEPAFMEAAPIQSGGQVVGVLVARKSAVFISDITNSQGIGKRGYAFILGPDSTLYAHPNKDYVLKQMNVFKDVETGGALKSYGLALQALGLGNRGMANYDLSGEKRLTAMAPIPGTDWAIGIGNYEADVLAGINSLRNILIIISVVVIVAGIFAAMVLGGRISKPIRNLRELANKVALGDVEVDTRTNLKDEVGDLIVAFGEMVGNIKAQAQAAEKIAKGDLSVDIRARSDKDVLAISMGSVVETLRRLVTEAETLTDAAVKGQLSTRGNAEAFQGGYRDIVNGVNETLDAVIGPLNMTAEYVERISKGNIPPKITETYLGDFNEIKNNLNNCIDVMDGLIGETSKLAKAVQEGKLDQRGNSGDLTEVGAKWWQASTV
jgi:methyl-accepting chemotaxis protein